MAWFVLLICPVFSVCEIDKYFTECDLYNQRSVIFYSRDCNDTTPNPLFNLTCQKSCDPGYRLDVENQTLSCSVCPAGTFSTGGGIRLGEGGSD